MERRKVCSLRPRRLGHGPGSSLRVQVLKSNMENTATPRHRLSLSMEHVRNNFTRPVAASIRKQFARGKLHEMARLLTVLLLSGNSSMEYALRAGISVLERDQENYSLLIEHISNFKQSLGLVQGQVRLFRGLALLRDGKIQQAHEVFSESSHQRVANCQEYQNELSLISTGYKSLLSILLRKPDSVASSVLSDLYAHDAHFVAFVQAYGETLHENEGLDWLKSFVEDWCSRREARDYGVIPFLQGLLLVMSIIPESQKLKFYLLRQLSEIDPSDSNVLTLCTMLLRNEVPGSDSDDEDSLSEFGDDSGNEEESISTEQRTDNLIGCLRLVMQHLDYPYNHESAIAWAILADCLSCICLLGSKPCADAIAKEWHNDRKYWWPSTHFQNVHVKVENSDSTKISNKALACFVFESENHPFVVSALNSLGSRATHVRHSFNQLRSRKHALDSAVEQCVSTVPPLGSITAVAAPSTAKENGNCAAVASNSNAQVHETVQFLDWRSFSGLGNPARWEVDRVAKNVEEPKEIDSIDESDSNEEGNGTIDVKMLTKMILRRRKENIEKKSGKRRKVSLVG